LGLLDRHAHCEQLLEAYQEDHQQLQTTRRHLNELRLAEQDATRRADLLRYQIDEIQAAHLKSDEEGILRVERDRLANAEELASLTQEALQALDEGPQGVSATTDLLGQAIHALSKIQRLDTSQAALHEQAQLLFENLSDLVHKLRTYLENIEFDPQRLQQLEERLDLFHRLKRKYGETISHIMVFAEKAHQDLDTITHAGEQIAELEARSQELLSKLAQQGSLLSLARHSASLKLAEAVQHELNDLHMTGAQFRVDFQQRLDPEGILLEDGRKVAFDATGLEQVEFLIAPNPGEGLKPLVKIASGGETSRLMLALKNVLARADHIPTLIFDEIDQGIGGRVGAIVGQKLWQLARNHQVMCITHLPQLATYGDQHYHVQKTIQGGRTATQVTILEGEDRIRELALMFGELSEGTLRSAFELLEAANSKTSHASTHN
jgi:DNA repair protein RecN (Recombination protein N)